MEDILWLIPARSGSNSIKDKNIKLLQEGINKRIQEEGQIKPRPKDNQG